MAPETKYAPIPVRDPFNRDPEDVGSRSDSNDEEAVSMLCGVAQYAKPLSVLLLLGIVVSTCLVVKSPSGVTRANFSDKEYDEPGNNLLYEVAEDGTTTAPPQSSTVVGHLSLVVSNRTALTHDAKALKAVQQTIAQIAGVLAYIVTDVRQIPINGVVKADFKMTVSAENATRISDRISNSALAADSAILSKNIAAAGLSKAYPVTKVVVAEASVEGASTTPCLSTTVGPCATTMAPAVNLCDTTPANPCVTTPAHPCVTTPCVTTPAPARFWKLRQIFR